MYVLFEFGKLVEGYFKEVHGESGGTIIYTLFYFFFIVLSNLPTYVKHKDNSHYRAVGASWSYISHCFSFIVFEPTAMLGLFFLFLFQQLYLAYFIWFIQVGQTKKGTDNIDHDAHFYGPLPVFYLLLP